MNIWIKSDQPEACVALTNESSQVISEVKWHAHRQLGETLLPKIVQLLAEQNLSLKDIESIAVYQGPGSFTGLRIGVAVANTIGYCLKIPVTGVSQNGWEMKQLPDSDTLLPRFVVPNYGREPHITIPKK